MGERTSQAEANKSWVRSLNITEECACCGRVLNKSRMRMLELDQRTQTFHDFGGVPESHSQGWFPFGMLCAAKKIKEHLACVDAERSS